MMSAWTEGWAQGRDLIKSSATDGHMLFSQQVWCFGHIGPYGENSLQSDQTATNSSRRQNTILVDILKLRVMIFELRVCHSECEGGKRIDGGGR